MIRKIIHIDEDKCVGCGLCVNACHQGAIGMVDGKAKLLRDDYCDGLGNCLPVCPTGAIGFEEREAQTFDKALQKKSVHFGCPSSQPKVLDCVETPSTTSVEAICTTHLQQWPVQIKLIPVNAPYFENAHLLIAADCSAYSYGNFHKDFMKNKITIIGCPKLDEGDYAEKLTSILENNAIKSVTVVRMEVPCCGGIENAVKTSLKNCGKLIPWSIITLSIDGKILEN